MVRLDPFMDDVPTMRIFRCLIGHWKWPIEVIIVDLPINSMMIFHSYVKLLEGNHFEENNGL